MFLIKEGHSDLGLQFHYILYYSKGTVWELSTIVESNDKVKAMNIITERIHFLLENPEFL